MFGGAGSVVEGGGVNATLVDLMAGYLAGVVAVLITGPLWLGECRVIYYLLHDDMESFSHLRC